MGKDRRVKSLLYAEASIPEYWIINLEEEVLEQYLLPENGRYQQQRIYQLTDTLESPLLPGANISDWWL